MVFVTIGSILNPLGKIELQHSDNLQASPFSSILGRLLGEFGKMEIRNWILGVMIASSLSAVAESDTFELPNATSGSESQILDAVKQKKYEQDTRITDLQINAEAGSLSRYSLQFTAG